MRSNEPTAPQQHILVAAADVFAEHGYEGARVDEIARRAGVNKAMLYYHVGNKQALYTAVLTRNFDRLEKALTQSFAREGSARVRLQSLIIGVSRVLKEVPDQPRIILREFAAGGANLEPEVLERMVKLLRMVRTVLGEGVESGEFRATDPVRTHLTLVGASLILNAVMPLRERISLIDPEIRTASEDEDAGAFLADLLLHGIATNETGAIT